MFKNVIYAPRRAGKTTALDGIIKNVAMMPNQKILYFGNYLTSKLMLNRLAKYYEVLELIMKQTEDTIFLSNGTQITIDKELDPNKLRGLQCNLICIDDAENIPNLNGVLDTLQTVSQEDTRCWLTISPESYHVTQ